jgi:hypothetical protein
MNAMKSLSLVLAAAVLLGPLAAHAGGKHKETYWDGDCKVERQWKKHGEYKEKRKCKPGHVVHADPQPVYIQPAPVVVVQPPVVIAPQPGVVLQGTVRLK